MTEVRRCLYHGTPCVCGVSLLPSRLDKSRLVSILAPSVLQRQPDSHRRPFGCWGAVVERVVPPQSAGGMIHVQSISSVGAMPVIPWRGRLLAATAVSKASTLLVCCQCAASVTATATMQRDGLTVANAQLYVWAVVVLTAVLRPLACNTGPTENDSAGAGMLRLSLISLRGE